MTSATSALTVAAANAAKDASASKAAAAVSGVVHFSDRKLTSVTVVKPTDSVVAGEKNTIEAMDGKWGHRDNHCVNATRCKS